MRTIRASSLPDFADCARRAAARQFREEVTRAGYELNKTGGGINRKALVGSGTHAMFETILRRKIDGLDTQSHDALDAGIKRVSADWKESKPDADLDTQEDAEQVLSTILPAVQFVCDGIDPLLVEHKMEFTKKIADPLHDRADNWQFTGGCDVIDINMKLDDFKTGGTKTPKNYMPQLGQYSILASENNLPLTAIGIIHIPRRKRDIPEPVYQDYDLIEAAKMAEATTFRAIQSYNEFQETADPNAFNANPQSQACSCEYCPAYATDFCAVGRK